MVKKIIKNILLFARMLFLSVLTSIILIILVQSDFIKIGHWQLWFVSAFIVHVTLAYINYLNKNTTTNSE